MFSLLFVNIVAAATKSPQLCPTLWDPIDGSASGSLVPGILQARTLEWIAIAFSEIYTLLCVKQLANGKLLYNSEFNLLLCDK